MQGRFHANGMVLSLAVLTMTCALGLNASAGQEKDPSLLPEHVAKG